MSIAEKLTLIAENEQKVYDAGFEKGKASGGSGYDEGFADGKKAEYDAFWDQYQQNGLRTHYAYAFAGGGWTAEIFKPKYALDNITNAQYMFNCFDMFQTELYDLKQGLEDMGIAWDTSKAPDITHMFSNARIGVVPTMDCSGCKAIAIFLQSAKVHTIEKMIVFEELVFNANAFTGAKELRNISFEGIIGSNIDFQACTLLTRASIESIITHLSDTASGKTLTLSKTAADTAFPCWWDNPQTGQRENIGCGGNGEWIDLKDRKSNWTITLV